MLRASSGRVLALLALLEAHHAAGCVPQVTYLTCQVSDYLAKLVLSFT
jgi:hypothetical protein